jgi:hypothetical protein
MCEVCYDEHKELNEGADMERGRHSANGDNTGSRSRPQYKKKKTDLWRKAASFVLVGLLATTTFGSWGPLLSSENGEAFVQEALAQEVAQVEELEPPFSEPMTFEPLAA